MRIVVQKYGGSCVATAEHLRSVARHILSRRRQGYGTVVVVSAMGDTTEELLGLARSLSSRPRHRELDVLLSSGERISIALLTMALQEMGADAISLTGAQSGLVTTDSHFNASIVELRPERLLAELGEGRIVVVAGYQGESASGEVTTLGRGGSDTTAVALAAGLGAERCEIFSDVEGVFTADPRVVDDATLLVSLDLDEACELARSGARVLAGPAAEYARRHRVVLKIGSPSGPGSGTLVRPLAAPGARATAVAAHEGLAWIRFDATRAPAVESVLSRFDVGAPFFAASDPGPGRSSVAIPLQQMVNWSVVRSELDGVLASGGETRDDVGAVTVVGRRAGTRCDLRDRGRRRLAALGADPLGEHRPSAHSWSWILPSAQTRQALRALHHELIENRPPAAELA